MAAAAGGINFGAQPLALTGVGRGWASARDLRYFSSHPSGCRQWVSLRHQAHVGQHLGVPQDVAQETELVGLVGAVVGGHPDRGGQTLLAKEGGHGAAADALGAASRP